MRVTIRIAVSIACALILMAGTAMADKAGAHYRRGLALKEQGKVDEAIAELEKAVAVRDNHVMAWASLGHLYKKKKQYDKAGRGLRKGH